MAKSTEPSLSMLMLATEAPVLWALAFMPGIDLLRISAIAPPSG